MNRKQLLVTIFFICTFTHLHILTFAQYIGGSYNGNDMLAKAGCTYTVSNVYKGGSCSGGYASVQTCPTQTWTYPNCAVRPPLYLPPIANLIASNTMLCMGASISFADSSKNNPTSWQWFFAGGVPDTSTLQKPTVITYTNSGSYDVTLIVQNAQGADTLKRVNYIVVNPLPSAMLTGITNICTGDSSTLTASGGKRYLWNNGDTLPARIVKPMQDSTYTVTVSDTNTCKKDTDITVFVHPYPNAAITGKTNLCAGDNAVLTASGGNNYLWSTNDTTATIMVRASVTTIYSVVVSNNNCKDTATTTITLHLLPVIHAGQDTTINKDDVDSLSATGGSNYTWTPALGLSCTTCSNPVAKPQRTTLYIVTGTDSNGCTNKDSVMIIVKTELSADSCTPYIPNAFSPNENGFNDVFKVRIPAICLKEIYFAIYDRWGEKIFETTDVAKGWDGTYQGRRASNGGRVMNTGVYVYYLQAITEDENIITQKGNVSLIR